MTMTTVRVDETTVRVDETTVRATRTARLLPWLGTLARLILGGVFLFAGWSKVFDLAGSGRTVNAYQVIPYGPSTAIGAGLPFVEIMLALLLLSGLATRVVAAVAAGLLAVYVGAIASVWARGLSIDCGCFGGGGALGATQTPNYLPEIARDAGLMLASAYVFWARRTRLALDNLVFPA